MRTVEVTPEKGSAPLGVILTGPPSFVAQAHDFMFTHGACSVAVGSGVQVFTIDWGDDPAKTSAWPRAANPECRLTHDYTAPGTYKIRVGFFKPGAGRLLRARMARRRRRSPSRRRSSPLYCASASGSSCWMRAMRFSPAGWVDRNSGPPPPLFCDMRCQKPTAERGS